MVLLSKSRSLHATTPVLRLLLVLASTLMVSGCSIFEWGEYNSFGEWYIGPAGMTKALSGTGSDEGLRVDRPPIYGHFRLPEIIFQPAGGLTYPSRRTTSNDDLAKIISYAAAASSGDSHPGFSYSIVSRNGPEDSLAFDWGDAGLVEVIPYRTYFSDKGIGYKIGITLVQPLTSAINVLTTAFWRLPACVVHDTLKTATIPFAAIHYIATADDEAVEPAASGADGADTTGAE